MLLWKHSHSLLRAVEQHRVNMYMYKIKDISESLSQQRPGASTGHRSQMKPDQDNHV